MSLLGMIRNRGSLATVRRATETDANDGTTQESWADAPGSPTKILIEPITAELAQRVWGEETQAGMRGLAPANADIQEQDLVAIAKGDFALDQFRVVGVKPFGLRSGSAHKELALRYQKPPAAITGAGGVIAKASVAGTGTEEFDGDGEVSPAASVAATGNQEFRGAGGVTVAAAAAGTGNQQFSGAAALAALAALAATGWTDGAIAPQLVAAGKTVVDYKLAGWKQRKNGSGQLVAWDDARAATDTGRAAFCGVIGDRIDIGIYTGLDGVNKFTILTGAIFMGTPASGSGNASHAISGRWGNTNGSKQWAFGIRNNSATANIEFRMSNLAGTTYSWRTILTIVTGMFYQFGYLGDLTAGTDLGKGSLIYRSFDPATQTWSAWLTDAGAASSAGWPATVPVVAGGESAANRTMALGRLKASSSGSNAFRGLFDDFKLFPGALLTQAQITAAFGDSRADGNWVEPDLWYPFVPDFKNKANSGAQWDGTVFGDIVLCTDDKSVGRTEVSGGGTTNPTVNANGDVVYDGVDDYTQGDGGLVTGITQDCALIVVGQAPQSGKTLAVVSQAAANNALQLYRNVGNMEGASVAAGVVVDTPNAAGIHCWIVRRTSDAPATIGIKNGAVAEVTTAGASAASTPTRITTGADRALANQGDATVRAKLIVKGDCAGVLNTITTWATTYEAAA